MSVVPLIQNAFKPKSKHEYVIFRKCNTPTTVSCLENAINGKINIDTQNRMNADSHSFWKLWNQMLHNHDFRLKTKAAIYWPIDIHTNLYMRRLEAYCQHINLIQTMHICWLYRVANMEVRSAVTPVPHQRAIATNFSNTYPRKSATSIVNTTFPR